MKKLNVGVIGVGSMGANHVRVYSEMLHDVNLVGFFEPNKERVAEIKDRFGIVAFDTVESLLDNVEAVSIVSPTSLHFEHALLCAEKNVHVLIEKPVAASYEEGIRIKEVFSGKNTIFQVGHIERFNPAIVELKNIIQNFKILAINFERLSVDKRILDASIVHDLMIHDIDILNWLVCDNIKTINAMGVINARSNNSVDYAQAMIKFDSGLLASLTASRITEDKLRTITIHTDESLISVDCVTRSIRINRQTQMNLSKKTSFYKQENISEKLIVPQYEPLKSEISSFVDSINNNTPPLVGCEAALNALHIADLIHNKVVEL